MTQTELPGMPQRLFSCTPTRLTTWLDCPRRYRFSYLDRPQPPKGPPWAHNSVGAAVHSALADWWGLPVAGRTPERGPELVRKRWLQDGFADAAQSAAAADRAVGWVIGYLATLDPAVEPAGVERTVSTKTRTLALSGRVDRIDRRPGGPGDEPAGQQAGEQLVIVDYKTGRYVPTDDDARQSLALGVYALGAARTLRTPCSRVELHHLPSGTVAAAEHSAEGLQRKVFQAESIGADAARADAAYATGQRGDDAFPPVPARSCSWCDFRRHCPEGQAAAPDREPWSTLAQG